MTLLHALPAEYSTFATSLMLVPDLTRTKVLDAFANYDTTQSQAFLNNTPSALATATPSTIASQASSSGGCFYCGSSGHFMKDCSQFHNGSARAKGNRSNHNKRGGKGQQLVFSQGAFLAAACLCGPCCTIGRTGWRHHRPKGKGNCGRRRRNAKAS